MPDVIALLPMKGHSERVPGKNLRSLAGKPLYHWVLESLLGAASITEVVIDTDSELIADDLRASFPAVGLRSRPTDLLGDDVPMHDIVARFAAEHPRGDVFVQTHSTNPLLSSATIEGAVRAFLADDAHDSLLTVTEWHTRLFDHSGSPLNHDPEVLLRTQDLPPVYEENSNLYIAPRDVIERTGRRFGANPLLFPVPRREAIDIDEEIDFIVAECLMSWRERG
jgi:CMP-N-acetylneuraminic acid synthetase